jgi:hypothetical protein
MAAVRRRQLCHNEGLFRVKRRKSCGMETEADWFNRMWLFRDPFEGIGCDVGEIQLSNP